MSPRYGLWGAEWRDPLHGHRESELNRIVRHLVLPALAPAAVVGLYFAPLSAIGCATRGLLALTVVLLSAAGAFVAIGLSLRARRRSDPSSGWWIATAAILTVPLALVLGPLG